jgi:hypothetical protein
MAMLFRNGSLYVVIGKTPLQETAGNDWQFLGSGIRIRK